MWHENRLGVFLLFKDSFANPPQGSLPPHATHTALNSSVLVYTPGYIDTVRVESLV